MPYPLIATDGGNLRDATRGMGVMFDYKVFFVFYCETNWNFAIHHFTSNVKSELSREKRPGKSLKGPTRRLV